MSKDAKISRRKRCCPICRREYIHKYSIQKPSEIDWRYIRFEEGE